MFEARAPEIVFIVVVAFSSSFDSAMNLHNNERYQSNCLSIGVEILRSN